MCGIYEGEHISRDSFAETPLVPIPGTCQSRLVVLASFGKTRNVSDPSISLASSEDLHPRQFQGEMGQLDELSKLCKEKGYE